jgi:hypothetical protein
MDHARFDTLARRVFTDLRQSRRTAVATLLGATLLRHELGPVFAKPKAKAKAAAADACYPSTNCTPGKGKNTSRCNFAFSTVFRNKDVRGSNLSNSSFREADLTGADFRGANLSGACFVGADLLGAKLGSSVNLSGAIFCNTRMPDGRIDSSGCEKTTACCRNVVQDCPDVAVECYAKDPDDLFPCHSFLGTLPPVGQCWNGILCCTCDHPNDADYWANQCKQYFNTGGVEQCGFDEDHACVARDNHVPGFTCFTGCGI